MIPHTFLSPKLSGMTFRASATLGPKLKNTPSVYGEQLARALIINAGHKQRTSGVNPEPPTVVS